MATVDSGADCQTGAVHGGRRESIDGLVASHNRQTRDGPVKDPKLRTRLGDGHRRIGPNGINMTTDPRTGDSG